MVTPTKPDGLRSSLAFFFSATLQPLCYVVVFPTGDPTFSMASVLRANFFSPSPASVSPAPALAPSSFPIPSLDPDPTPVPASSPAPAPATAPTPVHDTNISFLRVPSTGPISTQTSSSGHTPSSSLVLSPSLLSTPVLPSTVTFSVSSQKCRLPGMCESDHGI